MTGDQLRDLMAALVAQYDAERVPPPPEPEVIDVTANLQQAIDAAPTGAVLDLGGRTFAGPIVIERSDLTVRLGSLIVPPNTNDILTLRGANLTFRNLQIVGDGTTKRGVSAQGVTMLFEDCEIRNIRRAGTESQAVATWDGSGLTMRRCVLEGGSQGFLSGGAATRVSNHVPEDLVFEDCTFTRPLAWRGQGYACKTAFELKNARHVTVRGCTLENVWAEGQTGIAITLTPSSYGSPDTTVEDVWCFDCTVRNVGGGVSALGYSQHQPTRPTRRGHGYHFLNNTWLISKAQYGGQGALLQCGWNPLEIVFSNNNQIDSDGDALIRITDAQPVEQLRVTNNRVRFPGTYGIFAPWGSRGVGFVANCPGSEITGNTFVNAHSTFRSYFPNNTYLTEAV